MTSGFGVVGVDHVTVTSPEELLGEVLSWYRDCLGLEELERPDALGPSAGWFRAGGQEIHVSLDPQNPPRTAHFGLAVDDFHATVERLRARHCHIEQAPPIPGRQRCFVRDPAGNRIEIIAFEGEQ